MDNGMNKIRVTLCLFLLMLLRPSVSWAQNYYSFNPNNPKEPNIQYKIELECTPENIAAVNGGGSYEAGKSAYINTYCYDSNYEFLYWENNGEIYSRSRSFVYTVKTYDVKFIAHYKFKPYNPEEPNIHFMRNVTFQTQPEGVASFNYSGLYTFERGTVVQIYETGRIWEYEFKGWYEGDELISEDVSFEYTIPDKNVTLVARYEYNPNVPDDRNSFYTKSCDFLAESNDINLGLVAVEGLEKGRAVFGSTIRLKATVLNDNIFCGWFMGDSLLSSKTVYSFVVPEVETRIYIVAKFEAKAEDPPANVLENESVSEMRFYDLSGREVEASYIKRGPYIVREFINGKIVRTRKVIK